MMHHDVPQHQQQLYEELDRERESAYIFHFRMGKGEGREFKRVDVDK